jgi:hypothetical protein
MNLGLGLSLSSTRSAPTGTIAVAMGEKTPLGWGGKPTAETANTAFSAGTYAGSFKIDSSGDIVPANGGAGTFGGVWTSPPVGTHSITHASGRVYSVTVALNTVHVQTRGAVLNGSNQFQDLVASTTKLAKGYTVIFRDGSFATNTTTLTYLEPPSTAYSGTGRITFRSETVDTSVDANDWPYRRHGFKASNLYLSNSAGHPAAVPFDFVDIQFVNEWTSWAAERANFSTNNAFAATGLTFSNCSFGNPDSFTDAQIQWVGGISGLDAGTANDCTFRNVGWGIRAKGISTTIKRNAFIKVREADCMQLGGGVMFNWDITDNVGFDFAPVAGGHVDFLQFQGLTTGLTGPLGTIARNICWAEESQGIFIADFVSGNFTSGTIEHNIMHTGSVRIIDANFTDNLIQRWNTGLNLPGNTGGQIFAVSCNGVTQLRNQTHGYTYTSSTSITKTPDPQATDIAASSNATTARSNIRAVYPNYPTSTPSFSTAGAWTLAALKSYFTPSSNVNGALTTAGEWNNAS